MSMSFASPAQPDATPELQELYRGFEQELLVPLWTEIGDVLPGALRLNRTEVTG